MPVGEELADLFRVAEPKSEQHPTFLGHCLLMGRRYRIGAWGGRGGQGEREGEGYFFLTFTPADEPYAASPPSVLTPLFLECLFDPN